ncbi:MAG: hypothetical protein ABIX10_00360 [Acidimicrobiales bacterium]
MKPISKRVWSGLVAAAIGASIVPLLTAPAANAVGTPQHGGALIRTAGGGAPLNSGNSGTTFTLRLPAGAACGGDSANDGYRVQSYMVPVSVDPGSLTFNLSGPIPAAVGASFRQPLFDTTGTPYTNAQTANATTPPGPGPIVNIPDFNYGTVFVPGNIPAGQYNLGIACTLGAAGPNQMKEFWNVRKTFSAGGGPAAVDFVAGTPAVNGCKNSSVAGAEIGHYPAQPTSQSGLRISCTFKNNTGSSIVSSKFRINDFGVAQYHNGAARTVTTPAAIASGATTFTVSNFAGITAYVNRPITAVGVIGIPPRTFVKSISGAGLVTLSNPTTAAIVANTSFKIDNANARSREDVATTSGSTTITSATANFTAADVGLSVGGTNIAGNVTIASVTNTTTAVLSSAAIATGAAQTVTFGSSLLTSTTRQANDAGITSATVINSAAAKWTTADIGLKVTGPGIPADTFIVSVIGANATTTGGMTITPAPQTIVIGDPSATAPNSTDQAGLQGVQLDLSPSLVAGSEDCAAENVEGFATVARWNNPGSFTGSALFNTQPAGTKAIGQIYFDTSVADFSAFVIETNNPFGPGPFTYDIVFPNAPTTLAMCPGTATSPGLGFSLGIQQQTLSVAALPSGTGRPGTAQLRSLLPSATGGYFSTASVQSDDPLITFTPATEFTRDCVYPTGPAQVNFKCGNG